MKKSLTLLLAFLYLVSFSVTDADAKKRRTKQISKHTYTKFNFDANLIGCAYGEVGGF